MEKADLLTNLSENIITVVFTKKDGTSRTMKCTRNSELIPVEFHPKGNTVDSGDIIRVFDTEAQGWRSFDFTSVQQFIMKN